MVVIDFDSLAPGIVVVEQFSGVDFNNNAQIIGSLGPAFPAYSGDKVIWNYWDDPSYDIRVDAVGPIWLMAGGYVTGTANVTLTAYGSSGLVGIPSFTGGDNTFHQDPPNTLPSNIFLSVSAANIDYVIFSIESFEGYNLYTVDDFTFNPVPVPGAVLLGMLGLGVAGLKLRKFV